MFKHISKANNLNSFKLRMFPQQNKISQQASKPFFMKFSKKFFMQGNPIGSLLPVTRSIIIGNLVMWGLSWVYNQRDFITNFYYNTKSLEKGKVHSAITSQFVKYGTLDCLIDSFIVGMVGNNIEAMIGTELMKRLALFSALGSLAIIHMTARHDEFFKPDTFIRLIIYVLAVKNPHYLVYFFPLPIKIKIMYIAGFVGLLDVLTGKFCNFAPLIASFALAKGKGF